MIRKAEKTDLKVLSEMANLMWTDASDDELTEEFCELICNEDALVLLKFADGEAVGFAQCQLRYDYVEGTESSPVGYLEGIFIKADYRNCGYARELLAECESWARDKNCTEFASDCELNNTLSLAFHKAMDFNEVNRIICFTKKL